MSSRYDQNPYDEHEKRQGGTKAFALKQKESSAPPHHKSCTPLTHGLGQRALGERGDRDAQEVIDLQRTKSPST